GRRARAPDAVRADVSRRGEGALGHAPADGAVDGQVGPSAGLAADEAGGEAAPAGRPGGAEVPGPDGAGEERRPAPAAPAADVAVDAAEHAGCRDANPEGGRHLSVLR